MAALERAARPPEPVTLREIEGITAPGRIPVGTIGTLNTTLLPSLGVHGGLSIITYGLARATNSVDLKDYLWPSGMVLNAWYAAFGRHIIFSDDSPGKVLSGLNFYQQALLGGVTLWGARLFARIISRSLARKDGKDDPRYRQLKQQPGFWSKTAVLQFGLEAVAQTVIALPFTLPFRTDAVFGLTVPIHDFYMYARWLAAGLFTAGLALETVADWQLDSHKAKEERERSEKSGLYRGGVWSIVRHPNYLGDALVHFSFPLWTYGSRLFSPWQLLGPVVNYAFLRFVGGDRENEANQLERYSKDNPTKYVQLLGWQESENSFWPSVKQFANPWTLAILGVGALGALAESALEGLALGNAPGLAEGMNSAYMANAP